MQEEKLIEIVNYLLENLEELQSEMYNGNEFILGEKTAYVEMLEILQELDKNRKLGLNFDIEKRYPI